MEKNFCEGFLETGFLCFKTLPYIWRISTVTGYIWNNGFDCAVSQEAMKSWFFLLKRFIKCSTSARGGGISENIHWRFLSWLKCRFQDMSEESVLNLLGQYFNGIYLVKAIHSQNSVIQAGFCSFLLHWSDRWRIPSHTLPYSFLYCMTDPLIRLKCLQLLLRFLNTKLCNNLHYFIIPPFISRFSLYFTYSQREFKKCHSTQK